jgi:hypothetical protein
MGSGSKLITFDPPCSAETREDIRILARSLNSPQVPSTFPQLPQVISASCTHFAGTVIEAPPHAGHMKCNVISTPRPSGVFLKGKQRTTNPVNSRIDAPRHFAVQRCAIATSH